jgi:hypothetical protein
MKLKTYQLAPLLLLTILIPIVTVISLSSHTRAQTKLTSSQSESTNAETVCKGNHRSRKEFYDSARLLPPLMVLEIVGNRLNYSIVDQGIHLGSLELENDYSIVPKDFASKHDGCFGVTYCSVHKVILYIQDVPPEQCHIIKN